MHKRKDCKEDAEQKRTATIEKLQKNYIKWILFHDFSVISDKLG